MPYFNIVAAPKKREKLIVLQSRPGFFGTHCILWYTYANLQ